MWLECARKSEVLEDPHDFAVEMYGSGQVKQPGLAIDHNGVDTHCTEQICERCAGGPEADTHVFAVLRPTKAVIMRMYGIKGRFTWRAA